MAGEWLEETLGDLSSYLNRGAAPHYVDEGGITVLNQKCVRDQRISFDRARRTDHLKRPVNPERVLQQWDILVNSTGVGTLGRVAQVNWLPEPTTVDSHITIVRPNPKAVDPRFQSLRRTRLGHDVIAFAAVRSAALRIEQERRFNEGASDADQIEVLRQRLNALETELAETEAEGAQNFELAAAEEERAKLAESQLNASRARIQSLEARLNAQGLHPDDGLIIPDSWDGFAEWCDQNFVGRCVLSPAARRGVRKPAFQDVTLVGRCIRWLASTCLDRRINGGGSLANIPIEEGEPRRDCRRLPLLRVRSHHDETERQYLFT